MEIDFCRLRYIRTYTLGEPEDLERFDKMPTEPRFAQVHIRNNMGWSQAARGSGF